MVKPFYIKINPDFEKEATEKAIRRWREDIQLLEACIAKGEDRIKRIDQITNCDPHKWVTTKNDMWPEEKMCSLCGWKNYK